MHRANKLCRMTYKEYNNCIEILKTKKKWFSRENVNEKLACLEKFKVSDTPIYIYVLVPYLRDEDDSIRNRTAEVVLLLFS